MQQKRLLKFLLLALILLTASPGAFAEDIIMSPTPQTVTVGATPVSLYDDGGKDGNSEISASYGDKTDYQVTLLPGVEGQKVQVNFSSVAIREGSFYSQYIKVYNGTKVEESALIRSVKNGETALIHSTSSDGALTVVYGTTMSYSSYYAMAGFEAQASLYTPQPMSLKSVSVKQASTDNVAFGDKNQPVLNINVRTENTESPLTAGAFSFTANGTYAQLSKAALYYTALDSTSFSTTVKVGEATVDGDNFTITPTTDITLSEGNNWFWLACDISDNAKDGADVDASLVSAVIGGNSATPADGNPEGVRKVRNVVYSHESQGSVEKTVFGSVAFRTKAKNEYSDNYEAGTDDRINIFTPGDAGYVCQIDFSNFDIYYSSSSYGSRAKLRIYAGKGTTGTLLWELNSADDKSKGPGKLIRSNSADGALTVVFNPNDSYGYYSSTGFSATVSEYKQQPMRLDTITVAQATTDDASVGLRKQALLTVNIQTTGDLQPLAMSSMTVNLKGSGTSISNVSVLQNDSVLADAAPNGADAVTLTFSKPFTLSEGENTFTIAYDVLAGLKSGGTIDAALTSVSIGGNAVAVANGDPEGSRSLVNAVNMQSGDNGEIVVTSDNPLMFYDDGGKDGNESSSFTGTVTFAPANHGDAIRLKFDVDAWDVAYYDNMFIYMGDSVKDKEDAKYGRYDKPASVFSTSADGKITIKYTTSTYSSSAGFAIEVTSFTPRPLSIASAATTAIAPERVRKNQNDVPMQRIDVNVTGETGALSIDSIAVVLSGTGISKARVYQTDTLSSFSSNKLYAEIVDGKAQGTDTLTKSGIYRFWIAADIDGSAEVGNTPGVSVTAVNGIAIAGAATASTRVDEGMHGTYTVGKEGDYKTIQSAIDALGFGIDGPVTILVDKGEYNELVNIPAIEGMSATNTVTLKSKSGNYTDVRIYYDRYSAPGYSSDQAAREYGVVTFDGASYFTLRGIEVSTTDLSFPSVVHLRNQSRHITVDSCYIHTGISSDRQQDITTVNMYSKDVANSNNDYFTLSNSLIEGGYYNAKIGGTGYTTLPKEVGAVIVGNTFRNAGLKALYVSGEDSVQILHNTITNNVAETNECVGIDIQSEGGRIEGNSISLDTKTYGSALYVRLLNGTAEKPAIIANNEITVNCQNAADGTSAGMNLNKGAKHILIAYNTVRVKSPSTSSALILNHRSLGDIRVVNNIFQNEAGGNVYHIYRAATADSAKFSNNNILSDGVLSQVGSTVYNFAAWQAAKRDSLSHNDSIAFLSDEILEPAEALNLRTALPLSDIKYDITGTFRNQVTPTIGAYEYDADTSAPNFKDGYPKVTATTDSTATIAVSSDKAATAYVLVRKANDAAPIAGEVQSGGKQVLVRANAIATVLADSLTKDETYVAYVMLKSLRGTYGDMEETGRFTANGEGGYVQQKLTVSVSEDKVTVESGSSITLAATAANGTAPYTYTWTNAALQPVEMPISPKACGDYIVTVTDAEGNTASDTSRVIVTGDAVTATFDDLYLDNESYWNGYNHPNKFGSFVSGSYEFSNSNTPAWDYWTDFAYTNTTETSFDRAEYLTQQYRVVTGGGHKSANYVVAYPGNCTVNVLNNADGDLIRGFYITNTAWVESAILNGDGMSGTTVDGRPYTASDGFTTGDYLYVDVIGTHADGSKDSVRVYLADYRSDVEADHTYLREWTWVDMQELGYVKQLQFKMGGSRANTYGLTTPTYFAIDDFNVESPATAIGGIGNADDKAGDGNAYNLAGQRVGKDYKGVVIVNGKKVLRK